MYIDKIRISVCRLREMMFNAAVNVYTFACLIRIFSVVETSSPWVSLSASDGNYRHHAPESNPEFLDEENRESTSQNSSTMLTSLNATESYSMNIDVRNTIASYPDMLDEHTTTPSTAVSTISINRTTQIYVRWPGSDHYKEIFDTVPIIINKTAFTRDIIWKLVKNNETNIQVSLHPTIKDSLLELSQIQVNFDPQINDEDMLTTCQVPNYICGPVVEIKAQQSFADDDDDIIHQEPIVEVKFDKTKYHILDHGRRWECVYWNEKDHAWKHDGLETVNFNGDPFITCHSTHLTLFSVLLDPYDMLHPHTLEVESIDHERILTIFSLAGSFITIPCVLVTISSYYFCNKPADSETTKIFLHGCVALLLTHASFHAYHWLGDGLNCRVINFWTHYSVTTFLLWAACDGVNMWRMLFNDIFNTRGRCFYETCIIVSWGFPLLTTTAGVIVTDYSSSDRCELGFSKIYEFGFYVLPCSVILCSNSLFFVWMMAKVTCKNSLRRLRNRRVKYVLALAQVFNMVWCITFPLLWFGRTRLLGQYLIALLVSTQGVLVLTVRCAKDTELKHRLSHSFWVLFTNSLSLPIFLTSNSTNKNSASKSSEL